MSYRVTVRAALREDVDRLAFWLREQDKLEIERASGYKPHRALLRSFDTSDMVFTAVDPSGRPICMFGVVPFQDWPRKIGIIWMVGTPAIERIKRQFIKECLYWIESIQQYYEVLFNFTDSDNKLHHRWLRWAGFNVFTHKPRIRGVKHHPFYLLTRKRPRV